MRNLSVLFLTFNLINAFSLPFSWDFFLPGNARSLSSEVQPHKIAIIGAGAGGSSAAFWIAKAKQRAGVSVDVDVFERENYVGGRSTVVYPYNDTTYNPIELGASIFVGANKNLWRATDEFGLKRRSFDDGDDSVAFWDGESVLFSTSGKKGVFGWWDSLKAIWRYGYSGPSKTQKIVDNMIKKFLTLYSPESPQWQKIESLAAEFGWLDLVSQTTAEYLDVHGISKKFSREVVESATRVNYAQNLSEIHMLEGACSLAATAAASVSGGNFQIFSNFLARSGAKVHLNTTVQTIAPLNNSARLQWRLSGADGDLGVYDDIILAAPYHQTGIAVDTPEALVPPTQPYVHLHVTLLSTTSPYPNPVYFNLAPGTVTSSMILTTGEGARNGGKAPEFNSLNYLGRLHEGSDEWTVKIFSMSELSDEWLSNMFDGKVGWVLRKEWDAYPYLPPTIEFPPVQLASGFYYVNAFEPFISTMETETISSRNIIDLLFRERFGTNICGVRSKVNSTEQESTVEGQTLERREQIILQNPEAFVESSSKQDGDFVLGWDC